MVNHYIKKYKKELSYFIANAPMAILASSLPGLVNYAVIIILTSFYEIESVGEYRLIMSYYGLIGLFSFLESSKIVIRSYVSEEKEAVASIFYLRLYGMLCVTSILFLIWISQDSGNNFISKEMLMAALFGCIIYPTELYLSYLQATCKFQRLAFLTLAKYSFSVVLFLISMHYYQSVFYSMTVQLATMGLFNIGYFLKYYSKFILSAGITAANPLVLVKHKTSKESLILSLANWLPSSLEHVDKLIIGHFFGLESLGMYTLAFSTGRFIYNGLKPAFYIYYKSYVKALPNNKLIQLATVAFTFLGIILSIGFKYLYTHNYLSSSFVKVEPVVYIMFISYGIALADTIYSQSYGLNKVTKSWHLLVSNALISIFCLILFGIAPIVPAEWAFIICASHYPIRHLGTISILSWLRHSQFTIIEKKLV
ncbi:lipopolysaccharide biosynthesis protein [Pseudodesulfovibrio piezophilus]|uniref:Polysaccharide biosynthesis protein n=1 Tax=Pseudodesulfovibrio piezophilus (strain DSM 21447 / JCM 15486 / C1TLV30) TaxID=1322246 RepID=M1WPW7_PSEP2|nr:hypothetical protein [Pseudodesulfovibrio piezophilus]CCH47327.1 membrane protein of unknown function [Pseudodesulfovibrio piezophilus C1TLV30]